LCRALLDAYPSRPEFAEVLFDIDKNLSVIVADDLDLELTVKRVVRKARNQGWLAELEAASLAGNPKNPALKAWHTTHCAQAMAQSPVQSSAAWSPATRSLPGQVNDPPPEWRQFDPIYFDLKPIRVAIWNALMAPSEAVLGFGVTYGDFTFIDKLREIVAGHLDGETQCKDSLTLKPEHGRVFAKVERVRRHAEDLRSVNVLRVVHVDAAPQDHLADFWQQVCHLLRGSTRRCVLLLVGDASTTFPAGVTVLPRPEFDRDDLRQWAANTIMQIKWPVSLAKAWTELLCAGADHGSQLDVGMVYEEMDKSLKEIRFDAEGFRRKLESRMAP
jgi:hypothetical protein